MNLTNFMDSTWIALGLLATNTITFRTNEYPIWKFGLTVQSQRASPLHATVFHVRETNVVTGSNERGCSTCASFRAPGGSTIALYHPAHIGMNEPYVPATERWVVTNIVMKEVVTLMFPDLSVPLERTMSITSTTNRWKLTSEWRAE